jgi:hypothetical protein
MTPASPDRDTPPVRRRLLAGSALLALALAVPAQAASPEPVPSAVPSPSAAPSPSAEPSPSPSAESSPSAVPSATPAPVRQGTLPAEGGIVEPGTYEDWSLGPTLTFDVPEGWAVTPVDAGFGLALVWAAAPAPAVLTFTEFPGFVFQDPCLATTDETLEIERTPDAIAADIAQSPYLVVGPPIETEVAGLPALQLDVATQQPMGCDPPETWVWANPPEGGFILSDGQQATFLFLTVGERVLVVSYETFPGVPFEPFAEAAMEIIETLSIDPSTDPGPDASPVAEASPAG